MAVAVQALRHAATGLLPKRALIIVIGQALQAGLAV